ncbi:MAG: alpha/beta hydrolase family protein, partial [Sphingomonas sp.]
WPNVAQTQPISFVRADAPPLLLMQGTGDDTVKPHNASDLAAKLTAIGALVSLKLYPGKSHNDLVMGLSKPFRANAPSLADSVVFLKLHSQ